RGGQRVLLLVVVAGGDVHPDVAAGIGEGGVADAGDVGVADVLGDVAGAELLHEHLRIGQAEGEGGVDGRQGRGVVLLVVVAGGDVEAEVAFGGGRGVAADRRVVGQDVVPAQVAAVVLAVVDHGQGGRIDRQVAGHG